jgi:tetratricopeptide (TPR) repeat protein
LAEYDQAERCFRRSLEISEEIDQTREMLAALYDLARVWAAQGRIAEAVELSAVILHHPLRDLVPLLRIEQAPFSETAERLRASLEAELEPDAYQAAWPRGKILPLETAVGRLLR